MALSASASASLYVYPLLKNLEKADLFGTYRAAEWICLGGLFALLIGALWIRQEEPPALR